MGRRTEIKGSLFGLLGLFIGRNNDLGGYWAMGKINRFMRREGLSQLHFDLQNYGVEQEDIEMKILGRRFSIYLANRLQAQDLTLQAAHLRLTFFPDSPQKPLYAPGPDRFDCSLQVVNDLGREFSGQLQVWCRQHNPNTELKSGRL